MNSVELKNQPAEAPQPKEQPASTASPPQPQPQPGQKHPRHSRRRSLFISVIAAAAVLSGLAIGFLPRWHQRQAAKSDTNQLSIPTVMVVTPQPEKPGNGLLLPAEIRPWLEASIYARANGYLKTWIADIGTHVQAGQLLALIETPDLDQQLAQAKAELVLAQANLNLAITTDERWKALLKTASVSEQDAAEKAAARQTAAASVEASRANVRRLEELVSFQRVVAPFAGTITIRAVDVGDLIVAGSGGRELFHLAQTEKLRVYVRIPEPSALGIAPGQEASLTIPESPGRIFTATVVTTSEAISATSRTLLTELEVDNSKHEILPYSYGEVRFRTATDPALTIPSNSILFRAQGLQVGVVKPDNTVELHHVQVGRDFGQTIEILSGIGPADRVIVNPSDSLLSGTKVRIAPPQKQNPTA